MYEHHAYSDRIINQMHKYSEDLVEFIACMQTIRKYVFVTVVAIRNLEFCNYYQSHRIISCILQCGLQLINN